MHLTKLFATFASKEPIVRPQLHTFLLSKKGEEERKKNRLQMKPINITGWVQLNLVYSKICVISSLMERRFNYTQEVNVKRSKRRGGGGCSGTNLIEKNIEPRPWRISKRANVFVHPRAPRETENRGKSIEEAFWSFAFPLIPVKCPTYRSLYFVSNFAEGSPSKL